MIAYKVNGNGDLSHRETLNNLDELNDWIARKNFATIAVESETTGVIRYFTDNGSTYIEIKPSL